MVETHESKVYLDNLVKMSLHLIMFALLRSLYLGATQFAQVASLLQETVIFFIMSTRLSLI
jgi:hypothetical protein